MEDHLTINAEELADYDIILVHNETGDNSTDVEYDIIQDREVQALFCVLYLTIFLLGFCGNVLVCYVVGRNREMLTVTYFFITNLALSNILLCALVVPFIPLYSFVGRWIFGKALCHLLAYAQGTSVYISTFTLTSIAIDRFFVIIYPFHPRMKLSTCVIIICSIWMFSLFVMLPYGIYMNHRMVEGRYYCLENWPSEKFRQVYGGLTVTMQFVLPFFIIAFCYVKMSLKFNDRARSKPGANNSRKEEADRERKRRTNRMLIAMVTIFGVSWMPLNLINILNELYIPTAHWRYYYLCFFMVHAVAMSSTCYNLFLYAWLNENFRKEFKQVLPCFDPSGVRSSSPSGVSGRSGGWRSERTCNGNETMQETLLPTSGVHRPVTDIWPTNVTPGDAKPRTASKEDSINVETVGNPTASYTTEGDAVHLHLALGGGVACSTPRILAPEDSKDSTLLAGVLGETL